MDKEIKKQVDKILKIAKQYSLEQGFLFETTFEKYLTQLEILQVLKNQLPEDDENNTKASAYNKAVDSSNKTLGALIRLITTMRNEKERKVPDPLMDILSGKRGNNERE
ncbi:hypothetical protein FACS189465_1360 [Clostridia bacterium]|nr:hypothetical protein FACS189465_1360 [Clostridia bacterium]